jgi:hypothetical protein
MLALIACDLRSALFFLDLSEPVSKFLDYLALELLRDRLYTAQQCLNL